MGQNRACQNCAFWHQKKRAGWGTTGECRRNPPGANENSQRIFPVTDGSDWCGEFYPQKQATEPKDRLKRGLCLECASLVQIKENRKRGGFFGVCCGKRYQEHPSGGIAHITSCGWPQAGYDMDGMRNANADEYSDASD